MAEAHPTLFDQHEQQVKTATTIEGSEPDQLKQSRLPFRFWGKVRKTDGCWLWIGSRSKKGLGYGQYWVKPRLFAAHRISWEDAYGPVPEGLWVLHKCDNPGCVRPDHLFLGTRADNMQDCASKGRNSMQRNPEKSYFRGGSPAHLVCRGEKHGCAKMTEERVRLIRMLAAKGAKSPEIAREFGLHDGQVRKIVSRRAWKHVE